MQHSNVATFKGLLKFIAFVYALLSRPIEVLAYHNVVIH